MIDNTTLLHQLLNQGLVKIDEAILDLRSPSPLPANWDFERVEGMLLGLAVGDSLGNTTESQLPSIRWKQYGEIRDYLPNQYAASQPIGVPSDDSQMAYWTLEQLIADGGLVPDHLARKFTQSRIFGIGSTVSEYLHAYQEQGRPWERAGQPSAGNGALMRIAPIMIPHLHQPSAKLWVDAALAGMVTHNDRASITCCVAFTSLLWECLLSNGVPEPEWWIDTFCATARQIEGETNYVPRNPDLLYKGPVWRFLDQDVRQAIHKNSSILEACERWYSGAYLLETMPCALYILARHGDNLEEAVIRAVNDTKDNDTIAAIVGAAVGALHGRGAIPARWIDRLSGRTKEDDDGHMFQLIESAKQAFWD